MLKKEHQILEEFVKKPWKKFTFKEVKKLSGKKSESYVYASLKKFVKLSILKEERAGNVVLYSLNLSSHKTLAYAGFVSEYLGWNKAADIIIKSVSKTIGSKKVTYDLARQMKGSKKVKCSEFAELIVKNL